MYTKCHVHLWLFTFVHTACIIDCHVTLYYIYISETWVNFVLKLPSGLFGIRFWSVFYKLNTYRVIQVYLY